MNSIENRENENENTEDKKVVVFVKKITSLKTADEALERIENRFKTVGSERNQLKESLESEHDLETRGKLVDRDSELTDEQKKLVKTRNQLHARRKELVEAREAEINDYVPEEISW